MELGVKNRIVLVTGGAGTIGSATCEAFASEGARVISADVDRGGSESVANEINSRFPGAVSCVEMDLRSGESISDSVTEVVKRFGEVHTVVNNAAVFDFQAFLEWETQTPIERHLDVGLRGPLKLLQEVWRQSPSSLGGSVVNVSSVAGHVGEPNAFAYTPIKAAIKGLTLCCSQEMASHGGWAVTVSPGHTWSAIHRKRADFAGKDRIQYEETMPNIQNTLLGRFIEPEEVGKWIVFAASPLGKLANGQDLKLTLGIEAGGFNRDYETGT